jgi:hypothetical protein
MKKLLIGTAMLFTALPFTFDGVTPTVSKAHAGYYGAGYPYGAPPYDYAGSYGTPLYDYAGGYGAPPYAYAGAAPGWGGGWGWGSNWGGWCYPTFDYSTGWNEFCPGYGFVFGPGHQ